MVTRTATPDGLLTEAVGPGHVPADIRALSSLSRIDYVDCFTLSTDWRAAPERWARALFGDTPDAAERLIWRGLLGLRLSRTPSPTIVAGWRIGDQGQDWIRLEACSWMLAGNFVILTGSQTVSLATVVRYDKPWGRAVWTPLSAVHRRLTPGLLRDAASKVADATRDHPHRTLSEPPRA